MNRPIQKSLYILLLIYGVASFIHFVHNAEFLADYPNLPASWTRAGIYSAWVVLTIIGVGGWILIARGFSRVGLLLLAVYAAFGMDSLGHYIVAPMSDHTLAMNLTILFEVTAAALVLIEVIRLMVHHIIRRPYLEIDT